ncbi:SDR family oxidoreductase [Bacteroides gallinaceum]|uniref:SDR family oxidoreductase n=1 Tax=Bacteroides gallinaceum TaxID=1462571 RepID=A0ABT7X1W7_9BACE|nr:SDR family oxidoreductase [Bacteroides gallinaceum]MDN0048056.1 SDR family oxidoreductase [Bacteroides gallinaceum]MDN0067880.1 SDR family oxidoreductase [Bacteroides gallinaceum]
MSLKQYLKRGCRFILNGVPVKNITANIMYLQPNGRLSGKKIIITGGGKGLGAAMAEKFVAEGASVLISGRNEKTLKETAERIGCKYFTLDVQDTSVLNKFISEADSILEGADCLVNNAGISLHEPTFFDVTPETFDAQIATNLRGGFFLTQSFTRLLLKEKRKGNVLFVSSETGETVDIRPYGFTKAAVNSMVQGLACLFVKDGIRVNAIAPGITASDMTGFKANGNLFLAGNATERIYLPEEVAETACFLLSDASGCVSGQVIVCNNGKTINPRWK